MKKILASLALACAVALPASAGWGNYCIGLDPGHGGNDPGATGPQAPHEAELALKCCKSIQAQLLSAGLPSAHMHMTRTTNTTVSLTSRRSMSITWDPWIFCSVHLNSAGVNTAQGTETWHYWSGRSYTLATKVQSQLVANMGRANRGVKNEAWTVITGGSYIPAVLTEGLFVNNPTEWSMLAKNTNNGYNGWVNGHLKGFTDFLRVDVEGGLPYPPLLGSSGGGTTPAQPKLTVGAETVNFECFVGETPEVSIPVKGENLSSDIIVTAFSNYTVEIVGRDSQGKLNMGKTGGTLKLRIVDGHNTAPTELGSDKCFFKVTSGSITKQINGTVKIKARPLSEMKETWNLSEKKNSFNSKGYDARQFRNFCYKDGKLYCVYNHSEIKVINAATGDDLGSLSNGGVVNGGTLKLCDVKTVGGKIFACNIATAANGEKLRIYVWDDDNSPARLFFETSDFQGAARLGDCMEFGNGNTLDDLWIAFGYQADKNDPARIVEYNFNNGTLKEAKHTLVKDSDGTVIFWGTTIRAYPKGTGFWVNGKQGYPTWCTWSGSEVHKQTFLDTGAVWGSVHHEFYWQNQKYSLNLVFENRERDDNGNVDNTLTYMSARARMYVDPTGDFSRATTVAEYPSAGLSDAAAKQKHNGADWISTSKNTNATGDIHIETDGSTWARLWVLSTKDGLACYSHGNVPAIDVQPVKPAGPTISVDKNTMSFECVASKTQEQQLKVTGSDITGNITARVSGANADCFLIEPTALSAEGGNIVVTFKPGNKGDFSATLTLSAAGATDVTVELKGKGTPNYYVDDNITADKLKEVWRKSAGQDWVGNSATTQTRDIAYGNGKLYVLNTGNFGNFQSTGGVFIVDPYTGNKIKDLSKEGMAVGTYVLGSICYFDGKLIGANISRANQAAKIYVWDNDDAVPTCTQVSDNMFAGIQGGRISASGTWANGKIWITGTKDDVLIWYPVTNGTIGTNGTKVQLKKEDGSNAGQSGNDADGMGGVTFNGDGTMWVDGGATAPVLYKEDGTFVANAPAGANNSLGAEFRQFTFGNKKYAAAVGYLNSNLNGQLNFVNITDGLDNAVAIASLPEAGLGATGNGQRISSVKVANDRDNNGTVDIWVNVPLQGIAHYSYKGLVDVSSVADVEVAQDAPVEYYNLQGVRVNRENLPAGIYIRRQGNKAVKVRIR